MLTVTNGNEFNFAGRFDGVDFSFPAGKTTALPEDAAKHIFGVGLADKTDVLVRHGWMTNGAAFASAMSILNKFSFNVADQVEAGEIIEVEIPANDEEPEQGSAPLQTGSAAETSKPDGLAVEAAQPTPPVVEEEEDKGGALGYFNKSKSKKGS